MNEKIQAILLKIVIELKKMKWIIDPNWEITLKSENHVPLVKHIPVKGSIDEESWNDEVEVMVDLKLLSDDDITYFPNYTIYGSILINGGQSKDIVSKLDVDVAFTEKDMLNNSKSVQAANRIDRQVNDFVENAYSDYVDINGLAIMSYKHRGPRNGPRR